MSAESEERERENDDIQGREDSECDNESRPGVPLVLTVPHSLTTRETKIERRKEKIDKKITKRMRL